MNDKASNLASKDKASEEKARQEKNPKEMKAGAAAPTDAERAQGTDGRTELKHEPDANSSGIPPKSALYSTPEEALKKVTEEFGYWTGRLTETSLQMSYSLIAADWLIFGSVNGILHSIWAKLSLLSVLLALGSNVVGAWVLSERMKARIGYGEADRTRWAKEFDESAGKNVAWPFTDDMEVIGMSTRRLKATCTLLGGVFLIVGALRR